MIAKFVICIGVACVVNVLISFGLGKIMPSEVAAVLAFFIGIVGGGFAVLIAGLWNERSKY